MLTQKSREGWKKCLIQEQIEQELPILQVVEDFFMEFGSEVKIYKRTQLGEGKTALSTYARNDIYDKGSTIDIHLDVDTAKKFIAELDRRAGNKAK
jgi:hypothetical protein